MDCLLMGAGVPLRDSRILELDTEKFHGMVPAPSTTGKCAVRLTKGWRDSSAAKHIRCSCRRLEFSSQHPVDWLATTHNVIGEGGGGICRPLLASHGIALICTYTHTPLLRII